MSQETEIKAAIQRADLKILEALRAFAYEIMDIHIRATNRIPEEATEA